MIQICNEKKNQLFHVQIFFLFFLILFRTDRNTIKNYHFKRLLKKLIEI